MAKAKFVKASTQDMVRFMSKVELKENADGTVCWLWNAKSINENGYGYFRFGTKMVRAHRFSLAQHLKRNIPHTKMVFDPELGKKVRRTIVVDHKCNNRNCVSPRCLQEVTQKENVSYIPVRAAHRVAVAVA